MMMVDLLSLNDDDSLDSRDYSDLKDDLKDVEESMDDLVGAVREAIALSELEEYIDQKSDYDVDWMSLKSALRDKSLNVGTIESMIEFTQDMVEDLEDIKEEDVPNIEIPESLGDVFDTVEDILDWVEDELGVMDTTVTYDKDDLDDLEDELDNIDDEVQLIIEDVEDRIAIVDLANGGVDNYLDEEYEDRNYDDDMDEDLKEIKGVFALLNPGAIVESDSTTQALDNLEDIQDDVKDLLHDDLSDVPISVGVDDFLDDLVDILNDAEDVISDLPCATSKDDLDEIDDALDDVLEDVKDARNDLKSHLETKGVYAQYEDDFKSGKDDISDAEDDIDDAWDELDKLEGRCEGIDTSGATSIILVSDGYSLIVDSTGVDVANILATVRNVDGKLLSDEVITFVITAPLSNGGTLSSQSVRTGNTGQATVVYTPNELTEGVVIVKAYDSSNVDVGGSVNLTVLNNMSGTNGVTATTSTTTTPETTSTEEDVTPAVPGAVPANIVLVSEEVDPDSGGVYIFNVSDVNGNPVEGEVVTFSMRSPNNAITTYTASSDSVGKATVFVPGTDLMSNTDYTAVASLVGQNGVTTGIFISSILEANGAGQGGLVLGDSDVNTDTGATTSDATPTSATAAGTGTGSAGSSAGATSLPTTGALPLATYLFSSITSMFVVFRKSLFSF